MSNQLGVNLANGQDEYPFLNVWKQGGGWFTSLNGSGTSEETLLYASFLDANGYPTTLTGGPAHNFNEVSPVQFFGHNSVITPFYSPGGVASWLLLYDGEGTFGYHLDCAKNVGLSTPGRDVLNVTPTGNGMQIIMTSTDPNNNGNYIRNIRLIPAIYEALTAAGELFNPDFISRISPFNCLRFMDWMSTNSNTGAAPAFNPHDQNWVFWNEGESRGIHEMRSIEVMVALCNKINADAWFCMPLQASDSFITSFATYVHAHLASHLHSYVEYSNEFFNSGIMVDYCNTKSFELFGVASYRSYQGFRTANIHDLWQAAYGGDFSRVRIMIGAQGVNDTVFSTNNNELLLTPLAGPTPSYKKYWGIAIAPYFGYGIPQAWSSDVDGGLTKGFTEMNSGGLVPPSSAAILTTGTSTAYLITTGQSFPATPPDQAIMATRIHTTCGANPTIACDGGSAFPLRVATEVNAGAGNFQTNTVNCFCFMASKSAWIFTNTGYPGGMLKQQTDVMTIWKNYCNTWTLDNGDKLQMVGYESGQTFPGGAGSPSGEDLVLFAENYAINNDARMKTAYLAYYNFWFNAGGALINHFNDFGRQSKFGFWALLENIQFTSSPKYDALLELVGPHASADTGAPETGPGGVITAGWFSKKKWHALKAELEAKEQSKILKKHDQRKALINARKAADAAIQDAELASRQQQEAIRADMEWMETALKAAASARSVATIIEQANKASVLAEAIKLKLDDDEEEEALAMLLLDS